MALALRLRRALAAASTSASLLRPGSASRSLPLGPLVPPLPRPHLPGAAAGFRLMTAAAAARGGDYGGGVDDGKISPDQILFEGCDYNHWLITMEFPDPKPSREDMIETYLQTLAKVVGRRLQEFSLLDPAKYSTLTEIVEKEVKEGTARKVDSCARAILWLTRSMEFTVALLQRLEVDSDQQSFAQLVEAAYKVTLKPWHGWISSAAYKIAMKLIPDRKIFVSLLVGKGQDCNVLKDEIEKLVQLLQPFLDDIHAIMAKFRLDRLKST